MTDALWLLALIATFALIELGLAVRGCIAARKRMEDRA